jgi:predicted deacylase
VRRGGANVAIGRSTRGAPIVARCFPGNDPPAILIAGIHGDEPKSVHVARGLIEALEQRGTRGRRVIVIPVANPDGYARRRRQNARGVDLNRNFPTEDWQPTPKRSRYCAGSAPSSESETRALVRLIERCKPARIMAVHSISAHRYCNNYDGPARRLAEAMGRRNGYPVTATIGYPTPGSLGTWAGVERRIPVVTLELPSHHSGQRCWRDNADALMWWCG